LIILRGLAPWDGSAIRLRCGWRDDMTIMITALSVLTVVAGGALVCALLRASSRGSNVPTATVTPGNTPRMSDDYLLYKLKLLRKGACHIICPIHKCQGNNRFIRKICAWLHGGT
jgi:hypothetical protein